MPPVEPVTSAVLPLSIYPPVVNAKADISNVRVYVTGDV